MAVVETLDIHARRVRAGDVRTSEEEMEAGKKTKREEEGMEGKTSKIE